MCLIVVDWRPLNRPHSNSTEANQEESTSIHHNPGEPSTRLILASNRDEFLIRPSEPAHFWNDHIYAGKDLEKGGTWLACSKNRRLAAVTNYHDRHDRDKSYPKSRGEIPILFCESAVSSIDFARELLEPRQDDYGGFSALLMDGTTLVYCSNRNGNNAFASVLPPGLYGLSNHLLDTPWPKVQKAKGILSNVTKQWSISNNNTSKATSTHQTYAKYLLQEFGETNATNSDMPATALQDMAYVEEQLRSAIFVRIPTYGTRTTTIVTFDSEHGFDVSEQNHKTPHTDPSFSYQHVACYNNQSSNR